MRGPCPSHGPATTVLALMLAITLAACSAPAASTPPGPAAAAPSPTPMTSPAPSATPVPSPTPKADTARLFAETLAKPTFAANAAISGALKVGSVTATIDGSYAVSGADNRQSMTIAVPGAPQTSASITVGGVAYIQQGALWFRKPAEPAGSASAKDLASALRSVLDVRDVGTEMVKGRSLHRLVPVGTASIPLAAIGATDPTGGGVVAFEFLAEEDGTPVVMSIEASWTQPSGAAKVPAAMTIEFTFSNVGGQVVIEAPRQVWESFKSSRYGYTIARPTDWEATQSTAKGEPDTFFSAEGTGVLVWRYPTGGSRLNAITSSYVGLIKGDSKGSVTSNTAATVDGSKARRLEWTAVFDGTREYETEYLVVRGKYVYYVMYSSFERQTATDRAAFDAFLSTIDLPS